MTGPELPTIKCEKAIPVGLAFPFSNQAGLTREPSVCVAGTFSRLRCNAVIHCGLALGLGRKIFSTSANLHPFLFHNVQFPDIMRGLEGMQLHNGISEME